MDNSNESNNFLFQQVLNIRAREDASDELEGLTQDNFNIILNSNPVTLSTNKALKTLSKMKKLNNGETVDLSLAEITYMYINLLDAQKNLDAFSYAQIFVMFKYYMSKTEVFKYDKITILKPISAIIKHFNDIAPYEKYSGDYSEKRITEIRNFGINPREREDTQAYKFTDTYINGECCKNKEVVDLLNKYNNKISNLSKNDKELLLHYIFSRILTVLGIIALIGTIALLLIEILVLKSNLNLTLIIWFGCSFLISIIPVILDINLLKFENNINSKSWNQIILMLIIATGINILPLLVPGNSFKTSVQKLIIIFLVIIYVLHIIYYISRKYKILGESTIFKEDNSTNSSVTNKWKYIAIVFIVISIFLGGTMIYSINSNHELSGKYAELNDEYNSLSKKYATARKTIEKQDDKATEMVSLSEFSDFDDTKKKDGSLSLNKNILIISVGLRKNVTVTLDEIGSWSFNCSMSGVQQEAEWIDGDGDSNSATLSIKAASSGITIFTFTTDLTSDKCQLLVIAI